MRVCSWKIKLLSLDLTAVERQLVYTQWYTLRTDPEKESFTVLLLHTTHTHTHIHTHTRMKAFSRDRTFS
jgi:hypothetical protein